MLKSDEYNDAEMEIITYPEIYSSEEVSGLLCKKPQLPLPPTEPVKPVMPSDPGEYDSGGNRGFFLFAVIASVVIFFSIILSDMDNKSSMILPMLVVIAGSFFLFKTTTWDKEAHEREKIDYEKAKKCFSQEIESYNKDLMAFREAKREYDTIAKKILSDQNILKYRKNQISIWVNGRMTPDFEFVENEDVKKGVSEEYFYNLLCDVFSNIYNNARVPVGNSFYYPDLLICEKGLIIDVEIDEPYAGNDGTPIHYVEDKYGIWTSADENRNIFFTSHGFEVIRFSEEQIFLHPQECLDIIKEYVLSVLSGCVPKVEHRNLVLKKWTKDQASKWAYQRFRNTYVPRKLQSLIMNEGVKTYDELRYGNEFDGKPPVTPVLDKTNL